MGRSKIYLDFHPGHHVKEALHQRRLCGPEGWVSQRGKPLPKLPQVPLLLFLTDLCHNDGTQLQRRSRGMVRNDEASEPSFLICGSKVGQLRCPRGKHAVLRLQWTCWVG